MIQKRNIYAVVSLMLIANIPALTAQADAGTVSDKPRLSVEYRAPRDPRFRSIYDRMSRTDSLRKMFGNFFDSLPPIPPVGIVLEECGSESIAYIPSERNVRVCYEALASIEASGFGIARAEDHERITIAVASYAFFRTVADVYISDGVFPASVGVDDVADDFILLVMSSTERFPQFARDIVLWIDASAPRSEQRAPRGLVGSLKLTAASRRTFPCSVVGSSPSNFKDVADQFKLTAEQVDTCRETWTQIVQRFSPILQSVGQHVIDQETRCLDLRRSGDLEGASACFTALIDPRDRTPPSSKQLAHLLAQRANVFARAPGMAESAMSDIAYARQLNANDPGIFLAQCELATRKGDWKEVESIATHGLAIAPADSDLRIARAIARETLGNRIGAAEDVRNVTFPSPNRRNLFVGFGLVAAPGVSTPVPLRAPKRPAGSNPNSQVVAQENELVEILRINPADSFASDEASFVGKTCKVGSQDITYNKIGTHFGLVDCEGQIRFFGDFEVRPLRKN